MLESDHEIENEGSSKQEVDDVADELREKVVIDPLETTEENSESTPKKSMKDVVKEKTKATYAKVVNAVQTSKEETYAKVVNVMQISKEKTEKTYAKVVNAMQTSKEKWNQMRKNAMEKYPQYFTGKADKNRQAFQDFLTQGAEPVHIEHGKQTQVPFRVKNGDVVRWNFRALTDDIEFSVNIRKMQVGGAVQENVRQPQRFKAGDNHQGSYSFVYSAGQVVLTWSNAYSWFKDKHIAYIAEVVSAEDAAAEPTTGIGIDTESNASETSKEPSVAATNDDAGDEETTPLPEADGNNGNEEQIPTQAEQTSAEVN